LSQDTASRDNPEQFLPDPQQLNMYSYSRNNPLIYVDNSGDAATLALAPVALVMSPWAVIAGVAALPAYLIGKSAIDYVGDKQRLENSREQVRRMEQQRWAGEVQTIDTSKYGLGRPPSGFEDWNPNFKNKPSWMKIVGITGFIAGAIYELAEPIVGLFESQDGQNDYQLHNQAYQAYARQINSSSIQSRYQATQDYNTTSGANLNEDKLWVTPNGAVITWDGKVVAPAPNESN
jgi:hypothetical protein